MIGVCEHCGNLNQDPAHCTIEGCPHKDLSEENKQVVQDEHEAEEREQQRQSEQPGG